MNDFINLIRGLNVDESKSWMRFSSNRKLLISYWKTIYPGSELTKFGEAIYCIQNNTTPFCPEGNHKNFKQYPVGYFNKCNSPSGCKCYSTTRSAIMKQVATTVDMVAARAKGKATMLSKYGVDNAFKMQNHKEKTSATLLHRYGVDTISNIPSVREKKKNTALSNYGVTHPRKSPVIIENTKATNMERYGVSCVLSSPTVKKKTVDTMIARYGVKNYFDSPTHQTEIKNARLAKYGYANIGQRYLSRESYQVLQDPEKFSVAVTDRSYQSAANALKTSPFTIANYVKKYNVDHLMTPGQGSVVQTEITDWIKSLDVQVITNTRKIISPQEVDIWIPEKTLGIEYNGLYHHCEKSGGKSSNYHQEKYFKCKDKHIRLVQVCSVSYMHHPEIIRSLLLKYLGKSKLIKSDDCVITTISTGDAYAFNLNNCLNFNKVIGDVNLGLVHDNEIILLMSLTHTNNLWTVLHLVPKLETIVTNGLAKLYEHFCSEYSPDIVNVAVDLRYFTGASYGEIGFEFVGNNQPTCQYTTNYKDLHDIEQPNTIDRIWNCGYAVWRWNH